MNGRTVRGRLGNLTGMGTEAARVDALRRRIETDKRAGGAGALASGSVRRAGTGAQKTDAARRKEAIARLVAAGEAVPKDYGQAVAWSRTPPATKQPVYDAQGRPIGAIRFDPRTGESVFIPPRNAR